MTLLLTTRHLPEIMGAGSYFLCTLGTTIKIVGLFTAQPYAVLGGAILGGVACGLGV